MVKQTLQGMQHSLPHFLVSENGDQVPIHVGRKQHWTTVRATHRRHPPLHDTCATLVKLPGPLRVSTLCFRLGWILNVRL